MSPTKRGSSQTRSSGIGASGSRSQSSSDLAAGRKSKGEEAVAGKQRREGAMASRKQSLLDSKGADELEKIASIDRQLVELLDRRARLVSNAMDSNMESKNAAGSLQHLWQWQNYVERAAESLPADSPIPQPIVRQWLRNTASASFAPLSTLNRIAFLGPMYSYSYLAAVKHFGESANLVPEATIASVFQELIRNQCKFGVVPIENSTDGRVVDTLGMFAKFPVHICGEVLLPIHHCLLGRCARNEVNEVYSKPQALSQCRGWLANHLPDAKLIEVTSTAAAAKIAESKEGAAAIASREAGVHHGLDIIDANIEDSANNVTRFVILGGQPAAPTGQDKTAMMFQVPHQPGALADAMIVFRKNKLNLTWIESFPIEGSRNEYLFFIELEGHQERPAIRQAITQLRRQALRLEVLGSYPKDRVE